MNKKCPICGENYRSSVAGWRTHIWTHKKKTVAWLKSKRAQAKKEGRPRKTKGGILKHYKKAGYCPHCGKKL